MDGAGYVNKSSSELVFTNKEEFYNCIDNVIFKNIHDIALNLTGMKIMVFKKSGGKISGGNTNNIYFDNNLQLAA